MLPEAAPGTLADLPLGRRDALLLRVHESILGPQLSGSATCPQCRTRLEFTLESAALRDAGPPPPPEAYRLAAEGYDLRFRLPSGGDLAAVSACADVEQGRALLLRRCLLEALHDGAPSPAEALPDAVVEKLAQRMAECDPGAETMLDLTCPGCDHRWQAHLDIAAFVWAGLAAQARRLLREVHVLAQAYGWREADILAMSGVRRQSYLEMVD